MKRPEKPTAEQLEDEALALRLLCAEAGPALRFHERSKFRPAWVQQTNRDRVYEVILRHYREHGRNPSNVDLARDLDIPYCSVRTALTELRAEGRLIHRAKGVDIPIDIERRARKADCKGGTGNES